jgi:hypothetical protein
VLKVTPASGQWATASVRADFDNDGLADLAIGIPFEDVGSLADAGAVSVLYGTAGGLSGTGSQLFTQDSPELRVRPSQATALAECFTPRIRGSRPRRRPRRDSVPGCERQPNSRNADSMERL